MMSARQSAIGVVLCIVAGCLVAGPVSASSTSTSFFVSLPSNVDVVPDDSADTVVLSTSRSGGRRIAPGLGSAGRHAQLRRGRGSGQWDRVPGTGRDASGADEFRDQPPRLGRR